MRKVCIKIINHEEVILLVNKIDIIKGHAVFAEKAFKMFLIKYPELSII